jgi:hypothetical protein
MLNRRLTVDVIRAELAWVNETPDPNMCGCRHLLCCEQTSHAVGKCPRLPTEKVWSFKVGVFLLGMPSVSFRWESGYRLHDGRVSFSSVQAARGITSHPRTV